MNLGRRRRTFSEDSHKLIVKNDEVVGALKKSRKSLAKAVS